MAHVAGVRLSLFIANRGPRSMAAIANVERALVDITGRSFELEIVDVFDDPERALFERVLVTPTLLAPASARRLVGDLSEPGQLLYFLKGLPAPAR